MAAAGPQVIDVAGLPTYAFGHRSLTWWGTWGLILIESTVFAIALTVYFYLRDRAPEWPLESAAPRLLYGTLNTALLLLSGLPNYWTQKAAEREDLRAVRIGMILCAAFAAAVLIVRVFEFGALNTRWDANAYGSTVYALLTLHTVHLATDFADTLVLLVLMFTGPLEGKRYTDVSENAMYWWFVVIAWIPVWLTLYIVPYVGAK